jgi:hypothetical protein
MPKTSEIKRKKSNVFGLKTTVGLKTPKKQAHLTAQARTAYANRLAFASNVDPQPYPMLSPKHSSVHSPDHKVECGGETHPQPVRRQQGSCERRNLPEADQRC